MPTTRTTTALAAALLAAAASSLVGCAGGPASTLTRANQARLDTAAADAEVVAVAMHADWCATCQVLGPRMVEAADTLADPRLKLVKADLTDRQNPDAAGTLAGMGLSDLYAQNAGKTGIIYLVDADTGAVLGEITGTSVTADEIAATLRQTIARAS